MGKWKFEVGQELAIACASESARWTRDNVERCVVVMVGELAPRPRLYGGSNRRWQKNLRAIPEPGSRKWVGVAVEQKCLDGRTVWAPRVISVGTLLVLGTWASYVQQREGQRVRDAIKRRADRIGHYGHRDNHLRMVALKRQLCAQGFDARVCSMGHTGLPNIRYRWRLEILDSEGERQSG